MASLYNNKISTTYVGLIKTIDNAVISASLKELTDGSGNTTGLYVNTAGDFKVTSILEWGTLKDTGEGISITKFVDEADGIANNDNDTTIPTSAATKDYVDTKFAETDTLAEVLVFGNTTGVTKISVDSSSSGIDLVDDAKIRLGTGNDFEIYHDGSNSYIDDTGTGDLKIRGETNVYIAATTGGANMAQFIKGGAVKLRFNDINKFETTSDGVTVTGGLTATGGSVFTGASFSSDITLDDGSGASPSLKLINGSDDEATIYINSSGKIEIATSGTARQTISSGDTEFSGNIVLGDNGKAKFGTSGDLEIYHSGSDSYIKDSGTGNLIIQGSNRVNIHDAGGNTLARFMDSEGVELYYNNAKKFETTNTGVTVTGAATLSGGALIMDSDWAIQLGSTNATIEGNSSGTVLRFNASDYFKWTDGGTTRMTLDASGNLELYDNQKIKLGTSSDLEIYHDGSDSYIDETGTGDLIIQGSYLTLKANGSNAIIAHDNGTVYLYYSGGTKLQTSSAGITITGNATVTSNVLVGAAGSYFGENNLRFKSAGAAYIDHNTTSQSIIFRTSNASSLDVTALTITANGDLSTGRDVTIAGDLTVNGTTTTVNTDHFNVEDPLISMAKDNAANSVDIGTYGRYNDGTQRYLGLFSDASDSNTWKLFKGLTVEPTTTVDTTATGYELADLDAGTGTFTGTLNVSTSNPMFNLQESGTSRFRAELGSNHSYLSTIGSYNLYLRTNQTTAITLDTSQNATFAQNIYLADAKKIVCGLSDDLQLYHSGGAGGSYLENYAGNLYITNYANDADIIFTNDDGTGSTAEYFRLHGAAATGSIRYTAFPDNSKISFGDSKDLEIYHDGSNSYIKDTGTGNLKIQASTEINLQATSGESFIDMFEDGAVNLYYDNSKKFETTNTGVDITGTIQADNLTMLDNEYIRLGNSGDLEIYHDGSNSIIKDSGTGELLIRSNLVAIQNAAGTENMAKFDDDGAVKLYYNDLQKLETTSTGIKVQSDGVDAIIQLKADGGTADISTWEMRAVGVAGEGLLFRQVNDASSVYTNRMILDTDGFLGLGTITPEVALDVEGASNLTSRIRVTKTTGKTLEIGADRGTTDAPYIASITNHNLDFLTNDTLALTLDTSQDATFVGNVTVGAGAASTNRVLNLNGVASKAIRIQFQESGTNRWLLGQGAASENTDFELYNSAGTITISADRTTNDVTFAGNIKVGTGATRIEAKTNADIFTPQTGAWQVSGTIANASYPSYGFYNDIGVGMYRPSNDTLGFCTNSAKRLEINSDGVVIVNPTNDADGGFINSYRALISVSTSAVGISKVATYGGLAMVWMNWSGNIAYDLVSYSLSQVTVLSSQAISGGAASRTYTAVSGILKVAMGSGTYDVYATEMRTANS